jgi:Fumarylacetoacetate (FAA) hydrolase family
MASITLDDALILPHFTNQALDGIFGKDTGDLIATGTGVAIGMNPPQWLKDSDVIEAEVEGIGVIENTVRQL